MKSNSLDQFYTKPIIVEKVLTNLFNLFYSLQTNYQNYYFIEPAAGAGHFLDGLVKHKIDLQKQVYAFDIEPKKHSMICQKDFFEIDFQSWKLPLKQTITLGNPPFGKRGELALKFLNKSLEHSAIVAFILPNTFQRYLVQKKVHLQARLVYNEQLPANAFLVNNQEYNVQACFQVWIRPEIVSGAMDLRLKKPIKNYLKDQIELFIHNNTKETLKYFNQAKYGWHFALHRQGYYDYNQKIFDPQDLIPSRQYLFVKCQNSQLRAYIEQIDFQALAQSNNTTIWGFSNSDFFAKLYELIIKDQIEKANFWT